MGKIHTLYEGKHVIDFRDGNHTYNHTEYGIIPNATGVCKVMAKPHLVGWAAKKSSEHWAEQIEPGVEYDEVELMKTYEDAMKAHDVYSGERRNIGSLIHKWCEQSALHEMGKHKQPEMPVNPFVRNGCEAWNKWRNRHDVEWHYAERVVFHEEELYVGTVDGLAIVDGVPTILDYKTGKGVWAEAGLQLAAYQQAAELELGDPWDEALRLVLHLNTGSGRTSEWDEARIQKRLTGYGIPEDYKCFLGLLEGYNWVVNGPNKWSFLGKA